MKSQSIVIASLALPPPINGQTTVNARIIEDLKRCAINLSVVDTSPKIQQRTLKYHQQRIAKILIIPILLALNVRRYNRAFYTVVEPGAGMAYNIFVLVFARIARYRIFLHHHASSYIKKYDRHFDLLTAVAGRRVTHVALSEEMAHELKTRYATVKNVIVSHNACHIIDPGLLTPRSYDMVLTIGFLSNLSVEKGLDLVIDSFRDILNAGINARLYLAGPAIDERASQLLSLIHSEFGDRVTIFGPVSGLRKDEFFRSIDVFFFPSRYVYEAQPLVILEALSYGVPALTTLHGYCGEMLNPLGTTANAEDFSSFSLRFIRKMADRDFAAGQQAAARARFDQLVETSHLGLEQLKALLVGKNPPKLLAPQSMMAHVEADGARFETPDA